MKRYPIFFTIFFGALLLSGCDFSHGIKVNNMFPGLFQSGNNDESDRTYYLDVKEINYIEFLKAYNINVIFDVVSKKYYSIEFYCLDNLNNKELFYFENLIDRYPDDKHDPAQYIDKNQNIFMPYSLETIYYESAVYRIVILDKSNNTTTEIFLNWNGELKKYE